jgi:hypothetical protein
VAVFYPNKEHEIQQRASSRAVSPQNSSGKGLNFKIRWLCGYVSSWKQLVITKLDFILVTEFQFTSNCTTLAQDFYDS